MPPAPQGAPHGTSVCLEVRDTADVEQEGRMVLGELWGPFLTRGVALSPGAGDRPGLPARAAWGWQRGGGAGSPLRCGFGVRHGVGQRSVLASLPPCLAVSRMRGWQHRAAPRHQDPAGTPLLSPAARLRSSTQRGGMAPLPSGRDPVSGGISVRRGPACSLGSCSRQLPCAQPLPHAVYGHFLNTVFILTSL